MATVTNKLTQVFQDRLNSIKDAVLPWMNQYAAGCRNMDEKAIEDAVKNIVEYILIETSQPREFVSMPTVHLALSIDEARALQALASFTAKDLGLAVQALGGNTALAVSGSKALQILNTAIHSAGPTKRGI